jgi:hypothetical protein
MKYYTTASPAATGLRQYDTLPEAVDAATTEVRNKPSARRYVVAVVAIVEEEQAPVKVTYPQ